MGCQCCCCTGSDVCASQERAPKRGVEAFRVWRQEGSAPKNVKSNKGFLNKMRRFMDRLICRICCTQVANGIPRAGRFPQRCWGVEVQKSTTRSDVLINHGPTIEAPRKISRDFPTERLAPWLIYGWSDLVTTSAMTSGTYGYNEC